jgi:hypothetical protein
VHKEFIGRKDIIRYNQNLIRASREIQPYSLSMAENKAFRTVFGTETDDVMGA